MDVVKRIRKHIHATVGILILLFIVIVLLGCLLAPEIFYDHWIWKYYWGPLVADATGSSTVWHNGVPAHEGYTLLSEITYGIFFIVAIYFLYTLLKKLRIAIDWSFALALMPYIIYGSVARVLEDTEYFDMPLVYWFITPLIYVQIALIGVGFLIFGAYLHNMSKTKDKRSLLVLLFVFLLIFDAVYTLLWYFGVDYGAYILHPAIVYLLSFLAFTPALYQAIKKASVTIHVILFSGGLLLLFLSAYLIGLWILGEQWSYTPGVRFDVFLMVAGLVFLIALAVYLVATRFKTNPKVEIYRHPLNLSMIIGHMIDGLTSYISIYDPFNMGLPAYLEKHPASNIVMEIWPPLFPIVKFVLIVVVIYVFDVLYKEEFKQHMNFVNMLKIGIFVLGFSPGLRDLLRVVMGV
jgi:uncharacterized membrane protein